MNMAYDQQVSLSLANLMRPYSRKGFQSQGATQMSNIAAQGWDLSIPGATRTLKTSGIMGMSKLASGNRICKRPKIASSYVRFLRRLFGAAYN